MYIGCPILMSTLNNFAEIGFSKKCLRQKLGFERNIRWWPWNL